VNEIEALAARRRLLVASATLQRARLAHEWHRLHEASRPALWAMPLLAAAALAAGALAAATRAHGAGRDPSSPARAAVWATRVLLLWRLVQAWRR
jgi:hypothetical protein